MGIIYLPIEWFAVMCCTMIILFISVIILSIALFKMKVKRYRLLDEPGETKTINSNKFNIQLPDRKPSDHLLRVYAPFNNDQSNAQINEVDAENSRNKKSDHNNTSNNVTESGGQINKEDKSKDKTKVVLPPLILKHEMDKLCEELLRSQKIDKKQDKSNPETIKIKNKSVLLNMRALSMSTPDLDIYDVLPSNTQENPLNINLNNDDKSIEKIMEIKLPDVNETDKNKSITDSENNIYDVLSCNSQIKSTNVYIDDDDCEYSHPKPDSAVILDDESGYLLPLSFEIEYVNATEYEKETISHIIFCDNNK